MYENKNTARQGRQQERDNEDAYFFDDDVASFKVKKSEAAEMNPLVFLASAYKDFDYSNGKNDGSSSTVGGGDMEHNEASPPLPPLKPKYEIDDFPETFLRMRAIDSEGVGRCTAKHDLGGGGGEDREKGISFTMKKRKL